MIGRRALLNPILEAALVCSDRYARGKLAEAQAAILAVLTPEEGLRAIGVDIENVVGVVVVTDRRLMSFVNGRLRHDLALASVTGGQIRRLSSCSYAVALDQPGLGLNLPTQESAEALLTAVGVRRE